MLTGAEIALIKTYLPKIWQAGQYLMKQAKETEACQSQCKMLADRVNRLVILLKTSEAKFMQDAGCIPHLRSLHTFLEECSQDIEAYGNRSWWQKARDFIANASGKFSEYYTRLDSYIVDLNLAVSMRGPSEIAAEQIAAQEDLQKILSLLKETNANVEKGRSENAQAFRLGDQKLSSLQQGQIAQKEMLSDIDQKLEALGFENKEQAKYLPFMIEKLEIIQSDLRRDKPDAIDTLKRRHYIPPGHIKYLGIMVKIAWFFSPPEAANQSFCYADAA